MRRPTLSAWRPRRGEWDREAAAHLWERAGFGPAPGALERALEQGLEATLAELLQPAGHATGAVEAARHLLPLQSIDALAGWWMGLILADGDPLRERVTLMWHDHFATSQAKVADVRLMHRQNELMRELGLGDFRALMHALSTDPAMLVWLDGDANKRGEPNENFARELMELFGLGIGNYSEQDVQEAARAFTGWGTRGRSFALREGDHDPGTKQLFGERGRFRGEDAIRLVLEQPACARHIARRLLEEFVHPTPEPSEVDALAQSLVDNDWDIERTLAGLLASELFFSERARRARIAGPVELVARAVRATGAQVAPARAAEAAGEMGQRLFQPPSVKGWDGGKKWIDAGSWLARHNYLAGLASAQLEEVEGVELALEDVFGEEASALDVLEHLLPGGGRDEALREAVAAGGARADGRDALLTVSAALVLTSPQYQFV